MMTVWTPAAFCRDTADGGTSDSAEATPSPEPVQPEEGFNLRR